MTTMATYQIVSECAFVTEPSPLGPTRVLRYRGALVSADDPQLKHNLAAGLVAKVDDDEQGGVNADGVTQAEADGDVKPTTRPSGEGERKSAEQVGLEARAATREGQEPSAEEKAAAEAAAAVADERRKAARDKLDALGDNAPDGRASKDVLVEYLVRQGGNYDDLTRADKSELVEMVKSRQG